MPVRCPGQDGRSLSVSTVTCPSCGAEVEMFSDECRVRCHVCGNHIDRDVVPTCVEWCAMARECIGEERWLAWQAEKAAKAGEKGDDHA